MDNIKQLVAKIEDQCTEVYEEIEKAEEKKFTYNVAKNIRKVAQQIKIDAQNLRIKTTDEFKKTKK